MPTPSKRAARQIPRQDEEPEEDDERPTPLPAASKRTAPPREPQEDDEDEEEGEGLRRGHSAARQTMDSTSTFAQAFKITETVQVVKFLEDEPYVSYRRHWVERMTPQGRGLRSFTCLKSFKLECPLCDIGERAQAVAAYNIALVGDDGVPMLKTWDAPPKIYNQLETFARDPKIAPLTRGYFLVSRSGKKGSLNNSIIPVKAHSLEEDYDIPPPSQAELDKLGLWDLSIIDKPKKKDLEELAAEVLAEA